MAGPRANTHVYGPVPSRRLGLSLGIDLIPHKVCCFDCVYCQVGPTTRLIHEPQDFGLDPDLVVSQVQGALQSGPAPQVITLAGSGEPTLYAPLEQLVRGLRSVCDLPLVLLTNGALLWRPEVRRAALLLDRVYPSLDAADEQTLACMNRPAAGVGLKTMLSGLETFCQLFTGHCRLEVMLVRTINDGPGSLSALSTLARRLNIEGVDLNTVVRPPAHVALALDAAQLEQARSHFNGLDVQVIAKFSGEGSPAKRPDRETAGQIQQMVARRPCTAADITAALDLDPGALGAYLDQMEREGALELEREYYRLGPDRLDSP